MQVIHFVNNFKGFKFFHKPIIIQWLSAIAKTHKKSVANIQYTFCSDNDILEINKAHLNHNYYTDIITFDYSQNNDLEAEIFVSIETVRSNAALFHVKPNDELYRVLVHGMLHLLGYNDKTKPESEEMRKQEDKHLKVLHDLLNKNKSSK